MSSLADAHSRDGAGAAAVGEVLPNLLPLGSAAEDGSPADGDVVESLSRKLKIVINIQTDLTRKLNIVHKLKKDLSRQIRNARKSLKRHNQKAEAVRASGRFRDANHKERCDRHQRGQRGHRRCR